MPNGDEASPSNILAGQALLLKMLITLDGMVYFVCLYYNIVHQLVCKTVTRFTEHHLGLSSFSENAHNS